MIRRLAALILVVLPAFSHHFQFDLVGARQGYRSLPVQRLDVRVLAVLGDWLGARLR